MGFRLSVVIVMIVVVVVRVARVVRVAGWVVADGRTRGFIADNQRT